MAEGWIKLHRRVTESGFWTDSNAVHLWVHLLISATYLKKKTLFNGKIVELKEGQLITGRKKLSAETGISEQIIRKWLDIFEINQQITIEKTNAGSCISIVNFKNYQQDNQQTPRKLTNDQPTINQRSTNDQPLIEECKEGEEREEGREELKPEDPTLLTISINHRNKVLTDRAYIEYLMKTYGKSESEVLAMIEEFHEYVSSTCDEARTYSDWKSYLINRANKKADGAPKKAKSRRVVY